MADVGYVDHQLDAKRLVAADVLASLPVAGGQGGGQMRYGLTWNRDSRWLPNAGTRLALTVAGMWHLGSTSAPLLVAFKDAVRFLVDRQRSIIPSPSEVLEATATSAELARWLAGSGAGGLQDAAAEVILRKVGQLLEHEPYLWHGFSRPDQDSDRWDAGPTQLVHGRWQVTDGEADNRAGSGMLLARVAAAENLGVPAVRKLEDPRSLFPCATSLRPRTCS